MANVLLLAAPGGLADDPCTRPADVQGSQDACGVVAVSFQGDANGVVAISIYGDAGASRDENETREGASIALFGNATGNYIATCIGGSASGASGPQFCPA